MATVYAGVHFGMVEERRRIEERREKGNLVVRRARKAKGPLRRGSRATERKDVAQKKRTRA